MLPYLVTMRLYRRGELVESRWLLPTSCTWWTNWKCFDPNSIIHPEEELS